MACSAATVRARPRAGSPVRERAHAALAAALPVEAAAAVSSAAAAAAAASASRREDRQPRALEPVRNAMPPLRSRTSRQAARLFASAAAGDAARPLPPARPPPPPPTRRRPRASGACARSSLRTGRATQGREIHPSLPPSPHPTHPAAASSASHAPSRGGARCVAPASTTSPPGHTPTAPSPSTQCGRAHPAPHRCFFFFFFRARATADV